ncbi:MAG: hypothetical protein RLZZ165_1084, partial [Bacteroidota bacterium]
MKINLSFLSVTGLLAILLIANTLPAQTGNQQITLEDLWLKGKYRTDAPSEFNWMKDDNFYTELEQDRIEKYGIKDQAKAGTILDISKLKDPATGEALQIASYRFSEDESKVLLTGTPMPIYRHSTKEVCHVWDSQTNKVYRLHEGEPVSFATFSPDGRAVAYMAENNLFTYNFDDDKLSTLSTDGSWGKVINGGTDWVYEEEFAFDKAFAWSPDSRRIAFYRFDESKVREFNMVIYDDLYPTDYKFKYPKAGEANAEVEIHIHEIVSGKTVKADIGAETDQYIPRIAWTKSPDKLAVMRMNRLQNKLEVMMVDASTGQSRVILTETDDAYVEQPSDLKWVFLKNGKEFLWQSEADGHNHIYLYTL